MNPYMEQYLKNLDVTVGRSLAERSERLKQALREYSEAVDKHESLMAFSHEVGGDLHIQGCHIAAMANWERARGRVHDLAVAMGVEL